MKKMKAVTKINLLISASLIFHSALALHYTAPYRWPRESTYYWPRLTIGGFYRNHHRSFDEADMLFPLWQSRTSLFFMNGRGLDYSRSGFEGSLGGGWRHITGSGQWLYGLHQFYDVRRSVYHHMFQDINIGA